MAPITIRSQIQGPTSALLVTNATSLIPSDPGSPRDNYDYISDTHNIIIGSLAIFLGIGTMLLIAWWQERKKVSPNTPSLMESANSRVLSNVGSSEHLGSMCLICGV
jgi:hypothetical protein